MADSARMTPQELADVLPFLKLIKDWAEKTGSVALSRALNGEKIPRP